jgi:hypothetical protein
VMRDAVASGSLSAITVNVPAGRPFLRAHPSHPRHY